MLKIVLLLTEKNPAAEKFGKLLVISTYQIDEFRNVALFWADQTLS
jgi:hypothetical protein